VQIPVLNFLKFTKLLTWSFQAVTETTTGTTKPKVWEKQQKKKKGGASKKKKKPTKQPYIRNAVKKEDENKENKEALVNRVRTIVSFSSCKS
jgi:hypothetical protein